MIDYKITKQFIRTTKFRNELKHMLDEESQLYKIIMHHRFKLIACTEQEVKLAKKLDNIHNKMKAEPLDEEAFKEYRRHLKELSHHRTVSENLKQTIRRELYKGGVI